MAGITKCLAGNWTDFGKEWDGVEVTPLERHGPNITNLIHDEVFDNGLPGDELGPWDGKLLNGKGPDDLLKEGNGVIHRVTN